MVIRSIRVAVLEGNDATRTSKKPRELPRLTALAAIGYKQSSSAAWRRMHIRCNHGFT